ncbi:MAG: hypothetical protein OXG82_13955 [Gammaproteobacteria bacterium]|nr:hypothetical protein [Gammaproteobacteria bacterium]
MYTASVVNARIFSRHESQRAHDRHQEGEHDQPVDECHDGYD